MAYIHKDLDAGEIVGPPILMRKGASVLQAVLLLEVWSSLSGAVIHVTAMYREGGGPDEVSGNT